MNRHGNALLVVLAVVLFLIVGLFAAGLFFFRASARPGPALVASTRESYELHKMTSIRQADGSWLVNVRATHPGTSPWDTVAVNGAKVIARDGKRGPWKATLTSPLPAGAAVLRSFVMQFKVEPVDDLEFTLLHVDLSASYKTLLESGSYSGSSMVPLF